MTEQLINAGFNVTSGNNPDGWTVVETTEDQIYADANLGFLLLYTQKAGPAYIEQTVSNIDTTQETTLSFEYFDTTILATEPSLIKFSVLNDQGSIVESWTYSSATNEAITFMPPSETFTLRIENATVAGPQDFPVYVTSISLDATNAPDPIVPCFCKDTMIDTPIGPQLIQDLEIGDMVNTVDNGPQEIRWIGHSVLSARQIQEFPNLAPVHIAAGALGKGLPEQELVVSPQHRILVRSKIAERMFSTNEVLIPAIKLVGLPGIKQNLTPKEISYFHVLFDQHEIVVSNGAQTESLYTGQQALKAVGPEAYREIISLFPEISAPDYTPPNARLIPKGALMKQLAERHAKNNKPLVLS